MKYNQYPLSVIRCQRTKAFTLVELLVVIVVIGILASLSMYALSGTVNAAKESKTRGTISKLNAALMEIYESYQDKYENIFTMLDSSSGGTSGLSESDTIKLKQLLIYDLMRMEMPDQMAEADNTAVHITIAGNIYTLEVPPVAVFYNNATAGMSTTNDSAELLFLIIANLNPEALENFHGSEIGLDEVSRQVFLDAWGKPIQFYRFAPAFTASDIQPNIWKLAGVVPSELGWTNAVNTAKDNPVMAMYINPFDPDNKSGDFSCLLFPLIVSGGADGKIGLAFKSGTPNQNTLNPFNYPTGMPYDAPDGSISASDSYDNITNHRGSNSF